MTAAHNGTIAIDEALPRGDLTGLISETETLYSRGRIYLDTDQRERLGIEGLPYGTELAVLARTPVELVESRSPNGRNAAGCRAATARVRCQTHGEFVLPAAVRDYLSITEGDTVILSIEPVATD